jgi:hypothetical protein
MPFRPTLVWQEDYLSNRSALGTPFWAGNVDVKMMLTGEDWVLEIYPVPEVQSSYENSAAIARDKSLETTLDCLEKWVKEIANGTTGVVRNVLARSPD